MDPNLHAVSRIQRILVFATLLTLAGIGAKVFFYDGSPYHKRMVTEGKLEHYAEHEIKSLTAEYLFGGKPLDSRRLRALDAETADADERVQRATERALRHERLFLLASMLFLAGYIRFTPQLLTRRWPLIPLALVFAYLCLASHASTVIGGKAFSELAMPAHAARYGLCLLACMLSVFSRNRWIQTHSGFRALVFTACLLCASTFITHGWEAFSGNAAFVDLVIGSADNIHLRLGEGGVRQALKLIGIMDVLLGACILLHPTRGILWWMAFWGLTTALSRPLSMGIGAWHEVALRAGNFLLPLVIAHMLSIRANLSPSTPAHR